MKIRHATQKDAVTICENNIQMANESEGVILSRTIALSAVKSLINNKTKGFYLIAEEKDEIIGQLMITYEWSDWRDATIWWIQSVYIKPDYRKIGVFKSLYKEVKNLAVNNNVKLIRLYVHSNNSSAIKVYKKIGMMKKSYLLFEAPVE